MNDETGAVLVVIEGMLADPCVRVDRVRLTQAGAMFAVVIEVSRPTRGVCPPVAVPFEETVLLDVDHLEPGTYTVSAHGVHTSFVLPHETGGVGLPLLIDRLAVQLKDGAVVAVLSGELADPCVRIDRIHQRREGDGVRLIVEASRLPLDYSEESCLPVTVPFGERVVLDLVGLEPGVYTVSAHGLRASFGLPATPGHDMAAVYVASVTAEVSAAPSYEVHVHVTGTFPNPCVHIDGARQSRQGIHFEIVLEAHAPADGACPDVIAPFEHTLVLDSSGLTLGSYTVSAHGATAAFRWP